MVFRGSFSKIEQFSVIFSTIINTERRPYNLNNYNNKQNVQNERKIADHLAYNSDGRPLNLVRKKRESLSSFEEDNDLLTYDDQNDGSLHFIA